jgi:hypothetical protein
MDQAASKNQEVLGYIRKRRPRPNILYHNYLLPCGYNAARYKLERSVYEFLQILGISLTGNAWHRDLFDKKNINDVNVLYGSSEPNLFNYLTD